MVDVSNKHKSITVGVSSNNGNTIVTAKSDTSQYWANQAHTFSDQAKESVQEAKNYAELANSYIEGFEDVVTSNTNNIITTSNDCINQIAENTASAIDSIASTKTTILNDIEFVADGEKKEINELADVIKDNADTVNTAIEAGVERLNSIDSLKKSQITNCLLEVPQRIKYELTDGTLTIKAGSKVIVPNGVEVFDEVVISADISRTWTFNGQGMMFYRCDTNVLHPVPLRQIHSGTTAPTGTLPSPTCWYDTTNNKVKVTSDNGTTWIDTYSLPLCLLTANGTEITSIDQVFNGMGYIGSHKWLDKGVKLLCSNGRNEDGTLKNLETVTEKLSLYEGGTGNVRYNDFYDVGLGYVARISQIKNTFVVNSLSELDDKAGAYAVAYVIPENKFYVHAANKPWEHFIGAQVSYHVNINSDGTVSTFTPYTPFRAVDYNDFKEVVSSPITGLCTSIPTTAGGASKDKPAVVVENYRAGTSWYRVWSDGFIEQGGFTKGRGQTIKFTKAYTQKPVLSFAYNANSTSPNYNYVPLLNVSTTQFVVGNATVQQDNVTSWCWHACGY